MRVSNKVCNNDADNKTFLPFVPRKKPFKRYALVARPGCIFRFPSKGLGWSFHGWPRLRCQRGGLCWRFSGGDGQNLPTGHAHHPPAPLFGHLHKFVPENGGFVLWRLHPSLASQLLHHLRGSQSPPAFGLPGYLLVTHSIQFCCLFFTLKDHC